MPSNLCRSLALLVCLFGLACAEDEPVPLGGSDAGVASDGAAPDLDGAAPGDSGGADSGSGPDGGPSDGGSADSGEMLPEDACDPVLQSGCSPPTTKCTVENPDPNGGSVCVAPGTDVGLNEPCTGQDCLGGLACVATSTASATCVQVCRFSNGTGCEQFGSDFDCRRRITGTAWGACTQLAPVCAALSQAPCAGDQACQPYLRRNGAWELRCRLAGTLVEGMPCGSSAGGAACGRGLVCVQDGANNEAVCRRYCETNAECSTPSTCIGVVSEPAFKFCAL